MTANKMPAHKISTGRRESPLERLSYEVTRLRYRLAGRPAQKPIFILGTGRSGTHWLGWILESHPEIQASIEKPPIFEWVTQAALFPEDEAALLPQLRERYRVEAYRAAPRQYADKSHPNIWLAEYWADTFPETRFLGMIRGVHATVASMLKHTGVNYWTENWQNYPVPNRFLGITPENRDEYAALSVAGRSAMRWIAHKRRLAQLNEHLGERMLSLQYETMIGVLPAKLDEVRAFLGLSAPFPDQNIKVDSLDRWKSELTPAQIEEIDQVVARHGDACGLA